MRPPTPRPKGSAQGLAPLLKETDDLKAYQRMQVVCLRAKYGYPDCRQSDRLSPDKGKNHPISRSQTRREVDGSEKICPWNQRKNFCPHLWRKPKPVRFLKSVRFIQPTNKDWLGLLANQRCLKCLTGIIGRKSLHLQNSPM